MKTNKTYKSLLDKSINSMLSAIEIYNKPNFCYREETFAILAVNSWELLLKAHLLKCSLYKMEYLYKMEFVKKKDGSNSSRRKPQLNRSGNPTTIGIFDAIKKLDDSGIKLNANLKDSIEAIIELRDNAIHFHNEKHISIELQELGFACIKNYMGIIKIWNVSIDLSRYNFYLMPLAYVDSRIDADSVITNEVSKYLEFVKSKISNSENEDENFSIAISIDIKFNKSNRFEGIGMSYDADGIPVLITEEDIRNKFPLTYKDICSKSISRYSDFKQNTLFHQYMKSINKSLTLSHNRKLDSTNEKSLGKRYYNTNIWQELDRYYTRS